MNNNTRKRAFKKGMLPKIKTNIITMLLIAAFMAALSLGIEGFLSAEGTVIEETDSDHMEAIPGKEFASSTANTTEDASIGVTEITTEVYPLYTSESAKEDVSAEPSSEIIDEHTHIGVTLEDASNPSEMSTSNEEQTINTKDDITEELIIGNENKEITGGDSQAQIDFTDDSKQKEASVNKSIVLAVIIELLILAIKLVVLKGALKKRVIDLIIGAPMDFMSIILGYISALIVVEKTDHFLLFVIFVIMLIATLVVCYICGVLEETIAGGVTIGARVIFCGIYFCAIYAIPLTSLYWFCWNLN